MELRAFSDTSDDPIVLSLDATAGRLFGVAVADVLSRLDAGELDPRADVVIDGREVEVSGSPDGGLRLDVARA